MTPSATGLVPILRRGRPQKLQPQPRPDRLRVLAHVCLHVQSGVEPGAPAPPEVGTRYLTAPQDRHVDRELERALVAAQQLNHCPLDLGDDHLRPHHGRAGWLRGARGLNRALRRRGLLLSPFGCHALRPLAPASTSPNRPPAVRHASNHICCDGTARARRPPADAHHAKATGGRLTTNNSSVRPGGLGKAPMRSPRARRIPMARLRSWPRRWATATGPIASPGPGCGIWGSIASADECGTGLRMRFGERYRKAVCGRTACTV
jgi:hypothetical protein